MRELQNIETYKMVSKGVIKPFQTDWTALTKFALKKNGSVGYFKDSQKLNAVTKRDVNPKPRIDECIDSLGEAPVLCTMDANSLYRQVEIENGDRDKTAFTSHHRLYSLVRMPFPLRNAPRKLQRAMFVAVLTIRWQIALVYLNDIVFFSHSAAEQIDHNKHV